MKIEFTPSFEDFLNRRKYSDASMKEDFEKEKPLFNKIWTFSVMLLILLPFTVVLIFEANFYMAGIFVYAFISLYLLAYWHEKMKAIYVYNKLKIHFKNTAVKVEIQFDEHHIVWSDKSSRYELSWVDILSSKKTSLGIILETSPYNGILVPTRAFDNIDELNSFSSFVDKKINYYNTLKGH